MKLLVHAVCLLQACSTRSGYIRVVSRFEFQIGHYRITTTQRLIRKGPILDSYLSFTCIQILRRSNKNILWQVCANELNLSISWVGSLLTDPELFILFSENSQIFLKFSLIPILLTFIYLVALNLLVNNQLNSKSTQLIIAAHNCHKHFLRITKLHLTWGVVTISFPLSFNPISSWV